MNKSSCSSQNSLKASAHTSESISPQAAGRALMHACASISQEAPTSGQSSLLRRRLLQERLFASHAAICMPLDLYGMLEHFFGGRGGVSLQLSISHTLPQELHLGHGRLVLAFRQLGLWIEDRLLRDVHRHLRSDVRCALGARAPTPQNGTRTRRAGAEKGHSKESEVMIRL
eukprot:TRINITY_DN31064_c0_g1_i1.p1 TRINITY_DN31064_c0_g1~~TRINITY_DN31064_c0_g1_i1.p1  ORF type:complete len:172 (+),score=13.61 TRINITY_DN31064_c0_g1_i1:265-780(+)